jgi:tRNA threonylcarbamoyladenosine biosynthesis protein TsaB
VLLLAFDTCDARGSLAVLRNAEVLHVIAHDTTEEYSCWLLRAVNELLQTAGLSLTEVETYAVAAGPGSFTGVRVGLTTAKAWAEVYSRKIAIVSRLEAIATQASGSEPYVAAFADARRGQVFGALYTRHDGQLQRVGDEMVIAPEKFASWATDNAGPAPIRWVCLDPQCLLETQAWPMRRSEEETLETVSPVLAPVIGQLGYRLALDNRLTDALTADANYVRRCDAEIFWRDSGRTAVSPGSRTH